MNYAKVSLSPTKKLARSITLNVRSFTWSQSQKKEAPMEQHEVIRERLEAISSDIMSAHCAKQREEVIAKIKSLLFDALNPCQAKNHDLEDEIRALRPSQERSDAGLKSAAATLNANPAADIETPAIVVATSGNIAEPLKKQPVIK